MKSPIPGFARSLAALDAILRKGEVFCREQGLAASELLEARMAPTMKPLTHQVRLACNAAADAATRLAGAQTSAIDGSFDTFEDLHQRIEAAQAVINALPEAAFADADDRMIPVVLDESVVDCSAHQYLMEYAMPNFYFAMTTAYNILRSRGVPLGKTDFLGRQAGGI